MDDEHDILPDKGDPDPSQAELFEEIVAEGAQDQPLWRLDDRQFQASLKAHRAVDTDNADFAHGVAKGFKRLVEGLVEVASNRAGDLSAGVAFILDEDTRDVQGSAQWLLDLNLEDCGLKGELLLYISDLVFAAFDIAKYGNSPRGDALQALLQEQRQKDRSALGSLGGHRAGAKAKTQAEKRLDWLRPIAKRLRKEKRISIDDLSFEMYADISTQGWPDGIKPVAHSSIRSDLYEIFKKKRRLPLQGKL